VVSWYEFALWVHTFMAIVWVGGGITIQVFAFRLVRANDPVRLAGFARDVEWIGLRVFMPASILLLVFGFVLVEEGNWGYDFWVVSGLVVLALSAITGMAFLGPESGRIAKLGEEHGVEYPEVQSRIKRILRISRIELLLLIAVVFDMVVKPFA
jgi:uncharacterized membrane protein